MPKLKTEMCPCCGYGGNSNESWQKDCWACGFRFNQNVPIDHHLECWETYSNLQWQHSEVPQPKNWNPINSLARLALKTTLAKVKGRPPRMNR